MTVESNDPAALGRRLVVCSIAALWVAAIAPAAAQVRPRMGRVLRGRKEYGPRVLTQDGLRRCVALEAELDRHDEELADMSAKITVTKQAVAARERTLDSQRGALTSPEAIKSYNELVDEQSSANADLASQINAYNAKIDASEKLVETYNLGCAARDYYEDDLKAVRAELAKTAP